MMVSFLDSPAWFKKFLLWTTIILQALWFLVFPFSQNRAIFMFAPLWIVPLAVVVSSFAWKAANYIAWQLLNKE